MLGIGPLILAPLSETFGRRKVYLVCFGIFAVLQIPTALSPNIEFLIAVRTICGLFGSVGIANGGGTLSDMFQPSERAGIFGWYLLGPLLGPTIGRFLIVLCVLLFPNTQMVPVALLPSHSILSYWKLVNLFSEPQKNATSSCSYIIPRQEEFRAESQ